MPKSKSQAEAHFRRFEEMMKQILSVPKTEIEKRDAEWKKQRAKLKKKRAVKR
jgi:hypothetical protein